MEGFEDMETRESRLHTALPEFPQVMASNAQLCRNEIVSGLIATPKGNMERGQLVCQPVLAFSKEGNTWIVRYTFVRIHAKAAVYNSFIQKMKFGQKLKSSGVLKRKEGYYNNYFESQCKCALC